MRLIFTGNMRLKGQFHLGKGQADSQSDSPLLRDGSNNPIVPGTSWAGTFRSFLENGGWNPKAVKNVFGSAADESMSGHISRLKIGSSRLSDPGAPLNNIRQGVGIDRDMAAARPKILYDWETLSPNYLVPFYAWFEDENLNDNDSLECRQLLALLFRAMKEDLGFVHLGGKNTTGHGRFFIENIKVYEADFSNPDTLADFLTRSNSWWVPESGDKELDVFIDDHMASYNPVELSSDKIYLRRRIRIEYELEVKDFLLIKKGNKNTFDNQWNRSLLGLNSADDNENLEKIIDGVFQTYNDGGVNDVAGFERRVFIPGSSFKGVLRNRAEKILRTFDEKLACDIFSSGNCGRKKSDRCLACQLFGCTGWKGRIVVQDLKPDQISLKLIDHVAIDRFSGGAADDKKFDAWAVGAGKFMGQMDLSSFQDWMPGLLGLLFKDLYLEDLGVGYGTRRGYGRVKGTVSKITLWADSKDPLWNNFSGVFTPQENTPWKEMRQGILSLTNLSPDHETAKEAISQMDSMIQSIYKQ